MVPPATFLFKNQILKFKSKKFNSSMLLILRIHGQYNFLREGYFDILSSSLTSPYDKRGSSIAVDQHDVIVQGIYIF
uniref:Uncharacterized protein n=1 Tax=Oryza brachyantha TaxID=4533 RepID=J3N505_ORYBR